MSGHNRWSKLKRAKVVLGAAKGKLYTKLLKELTIAARLGGGDPVNNARLRVAIGAAREANMPNDNIARAVKRGTGELEGQSYEEVLYEGYGPGGAALLVECLTDNTNRTAGDMRSAFLHHGGSLGTPGSVKFGFQRKGSIWVKPGPSEDQVIQNALEAGAEDVISHGPEGFEVRTEPQAMHAVGAALEKASLPLREQKWLWVPSNTLQVEGETAKKLLALIDALEDNDDVQNVFANCELDERLLEAMAAEQKT